MTSRSLKRTLYQLSYRGRWFIGRRRVFFIIIIISDPTIRTRIDSLLYRKGKEGISARTTKSIFVKNRKQQMDHSTGREMCKIKPIAINLRGSKKGPLHRVQNSKVGSKEDAPFHCKRFWFGLISVLRPFNTF